MTRVVGYTYDAGVHCPDCTIEYVRKNMPKYHTEDDLHDILDGTTDFWDSEKNPIHPIFSTDEAGDTPEHCEDCHAFIDNSWSGETVFYAVDALWRYIVDVVSIKYAGDPEILDIWRDNLRWCHVDSRDELVIDLYDKTREHDKEG
jgi:hypothetical protein